MSEQQQFLVRASFLEIYNEEVRDLLSKNPKNKLELKERKEQGVYVKGLNSFVVKSVMEITSVLEVCACLCPSACTQRACMSVGIHKGVLALEPEIGCMGVGESGRSLNCHARL